MKTKFPLILFFLATAVATEAEEAEAMQYGPNVRFRNAEFGDHSGALEQCDGVAGTVPARYAEAFPKAEEAIGKYMDENRDRLNAARQAAQDAAQARESAQATQDAQQAASAPAAAPASGGKASKAAPAPQPAATGWTANQ